MTNSRLISLVLPFAIVLFADYTYADDFRGRIVKVEGDVYIVNAKGEKHSPEKSKFLINENETVVTSGDGKAVVQFDDGALSVLNENSKIKVEKSGWLSHLSGKIYYLFRKVSGKEKARKVTTGFTTIGIRGTTFIIYDEGDENRIALEEGRLNIESADEPYEVHKPEVTNDFDTYKKQMQAAKDELDHEYSEYKDNISKDFVEFKKSFDMEANRMISFSGNRVDEAELPDTIKNEFNDFSSYAKDYINAYKELDE